MTIITTSILNGTIDLYYLNGLNTNYLVIPGVTLVTQNPVVAVSVFKSQSGAQQTDLSILGTIVSNGPAVVLTHGSMHTVTVGADGTVATMGAGGSYPIYMQADESRLDNAGQIIGNLNSVSVYMQGTGSDVVNSGKITGGAGGVYLVGEGVSLTNTGTISGSRGDQGAGFYGVELNVISGSGRVFNSGTILGDGNASSAAVRVAGAATVTVTNTGLMSSSFGYGVVGADVDTQVLLTNTGTIQGGSGSVLLLSANDTVRNTGTLIGTVDLGDGDDVFDTRGGTVTGEVFGGNGNDLYRVSDASVQIFEATGAGVADRIESTVSFSLSGVGEVEQLALLGTAADGTGNSLGNLISGNIAANRLFGLGGADTIGGDDGNDVIDGGAANDVIYGGTGDDRLWGRTGTDVLWGDEGEDWLNGGAGNDTLFGGDGDDTLIGGAGRDSMNGGADADVFLFRAVSDSGTTTQTRDIIAGFESGIDRIDLSGIDARVAVAGNQAFTFIGTAAFSATAGQLRFVVSGGNLVLEADVNGDSLADFSLRLTAVTTLSVDDLIL